MFVEAIQEFFQSLPRMRWSDYLDILMVAFLIYTLLPLVRTSGASRILKVVVAVLVAAGVASWLKLYTVSFILNQLLTIGLIALVVLFQPELRRMLDHLGNVKLAELLSPGKTGEVMDPVIAQTVKACEAMSREKVGALIVFARGNRLDEFFKTGSVIDGQVSEQLIRNIFFPKASLHDGAMIIRDGRIAAAGCVLPLSDSDRLSADLGTRHRAGVGITEVTDAVVVIVSEETGTISAAVSGMLKRHLAPQTLERLLHNELCTGEPRKETGLVVRLRQKLRRKEKNRDEE